MYLVCHLAGMVNFSCEHLVLISDYLDEETNNKTYLYSGAAGRISNTYSGTFEDVTPVEEEDRGR